MLIRFGVSNHLSIRDYQEISFVASRAHDDLPHLIQADIPSLSGQSFLPVVALYGANAAGKSNLLGALEFFCMAIRHSYQRWRDMSKLPHHAFCLDQDSGSVESMYDCDVVIDDVRYTYGFALTEDRITKEWLYSFPKGARNILFQRQFSSELPDETYFGPSLRKISSSLKTLAADQKLLLLSAAGQKEHYHEQLTPIFQYFRNRLNSIEVSSEAAVEIRLASLIEDSDLNGIAHSLRAADVGIVSLKIVDAVMDESVKRLTSGLADLLREINPGEPIPSFEDKMRKRIKFVHKGADEALYELGYSDQSSGTRYLLSLLVPVADALLNGSALIVDEITTNLHTKLSENILALFTDPKVNKKKAQFIFSTHDTNLLSRDLLRRDEVWFAEKNDQGATCIYPLTDFKTRKMDNLEKGYLQGRFGAIPFVGNIASLLG